MNLNREQIVKALECCISGDDCTICPLCDEQSCPCVLNENALSLIKELTEEKERLRELGTTKEIEKEIVRRETRADTVRKMQERLTTFFANDETLEYTEVDAEYINEQISRIANELMEGKNATN